MPAPQVPDSLRGFYLFTEGIKQAFIEQDTAAARASLERSAAADPTYGPAWYELAQLLLYSDAPTALRYAERAFRTDTTDKWYLLQLGQAQILNDRYRDAIRTYHRLREADAQNPDSYRVLAMLYEQEGQPFSAIAVLDSAEVRFGKIDFLSELKRRLLVSTRQYDRAVAEAQALVDAAPYKAENHLLLGELYARQKKDSLHSLSTPRHTGSTRRTSLCWPPTANSTTNGTTMPRRSTTRGGSSRATRCRSTTSSPTSTASPATATSTAPTTSRSTIWPPRWP